MGKSIPISQKHGINPTLGVCMYCGKETGEIALLGKIKGDIEAPKYSVLSIEPCLECVERLVKEKRLYVVAMNNNAPVAHIEIPECAIKVKPNPKHIALMTAKEFFQVFGKGGRV